jgi:hypothetical protein
VSASESDDVVRLSRRFLDSLREGRIADACIQLTALHDVTPPEPRLMFNAHGELEAEPEAEL